MSPMQMEEAFAKFLSLIIGHIRLGGISGPVGIMHMTYDTAKDSFSSLQPLADSFGLIAFISVLRRLFQSAAHPCAGRQPALLSGC